MIDIEYFELQINNLNNPYVWFYFILLYRCLRCYCTMKTLNFFFV